MRFEAGITRSSIALLHKDTWPLVAALRDIAKPIAMRRPSDLVSPTMREQANTLFAAVRRILAHEPFPREMLMLREVPDWATLLSKLELAMTGLQAFRTRYCAWDDDVGDVVWHDEDWLNFRVRKDESINEDEELDEF